MKLLSIDVGIKNMGVCLFEVENKEFSILEWNTLDLLCVHKCCIENCNKPIQYFKNDKYYCKTHAKKDEIYHLPPDDIQNINKIKNLKIFGLHELCKKYDIIYDNSNTKDELIKIIESYIKNKYFDIFVKENCNDIDLIKVGININIQLNKFMKYHQDINYVIIENQISPIANRMKTIQGMVSQYFIINKIHNIKFVSSYNKLKLFNNKKLSYSEKKKLSIEITNNFLENINSLGDWKISFLSSKKKDDLADSFLQGYYYLLNNEFINKLI